MSKQNSKRSTAPTPDVDALAAKAAKTLHKAAKACLEEQRKERKGGHLKCAFLGFAAVAADNHRALAEAFGSKAETLLSAPLALIEAAVTKPVVAEAGPATRPAEEFTTSTNTAIKEK